MEQKQPRIKWTYEPGKNTLMGVADNGVRFKVVTLDNGTKSYCDHSIKEDDEEPPIKHEVFSSLGCFDIPLHARRCEEYLERLGHKNTVSQNELHRICHGVKVVPLSAVLSSDVFRASMFALRKAIQTITITPHRQRTMNVLDTQVGGTHYTDMKMQPLDLIVGLGLSFLQGNAIKYLSRYPRKGGVADLLKARDYCRKAHALLDSKPTTECYQTRATHAVDAYCEANGIVGDVREAILSIVLLDWCKAIYSIDKIADDYRYYLIKEYGTGDGIVRGEFFEAPNGDIALGCTFDDIGQFRIVKSGNMYHVVHICRHEHVCGGYYETLEDAKYRAVRLREGAIENSIRALTMDLEHSKSKYHINRQD
nr:MAG TPA: nucelotide kinase [Caudoviricetes sp.]